MSNSSHNFDYNIQNYSLDELKDIFGITPQDNVYIANEKMSEFFASSKNNPAMLRFFRDAQAVIYRDLNYVNELNTNEYDVEYEEDDNEEEQEQEQDNKSKSNMMTLLDGSLKEYYPSSLVVNDHSENMEQPLNSEAGGEGDINPLFRNTYRREVCVDSVFKKSTETTSSFIVYFPKNIDRVVSMRMTAIELPDVIYNVTSIDNRNQMTIITKSLKQMTGDTTTTISVPPGVYTRTNLEKTINNIMSNSTTGSQYLVFTINPNTFHSMIRAKMSTDSGSPFYPYDASNSAIYSPNFSYTISFPTFTAKADLVSCDTSPTAGTSQEIYKDGLGWILGYRKASYDVSSTSVYSDIYSTESTTVNYKAVLTSESVFNEKINDYIFVDVNDFNNNHLSDGIISNTSIGYIGDSLFARLPMSTTTGQGLRTYMADFEPKRDYFGPVNIDRLQMRLLNKYGDLIDLGGQDYSAIFEFTIRYA
jgi:hypothetical protein